MENKVVYLVCHMECNAYNEDFSTNVICAYMDENKAQEHLAKVYDKLVEYQNAGKCSCVERYDSFVDCCDLHRTDDPLELTFEYERWYIEGVEVFETAFIREAIEL